MTVTRTKLMLSCAVAMAAIALPGARASAQQRTSEVRIQELIRQAAQIAASGQVSTPTTAQRGGQTTAPAAGPKVALTLDDVVKLALDRNLDIAVQRLNPEIETLFLMADPRHQAIASRLVKEIAMLGGDISPFTTSYVAGLLVKRCNEMRK